MEKRENNIKNNVKIDKHFKRKDKVYKENEKDKKNKVNNNSNLKFKEVSKKEDFDKNESNEGKQSFNKSRHDSKKFVNKKDYVKQNLEKEIENNKDLKYFSDFVKRQIPKHILQNKNFLQIEPLALLEYDHEIKIKETALSEFLKKNLIEKKVEKIVKSPKSRYYRTTTKRKVNIEKGKFTLVFAESNVLNYNNLISASILEPNEHKDIYYYIAEKINLPTYNAIGKALNYVIIRGTYTDFYVIFNVNILNAEVVRKIKQLSDELKKLKSNIRGLYVYLDPTKSDYYLESKRPDVPVNFKNIFGPEKILVNFNGNKYSFLPTSFSQINESIVPLFLEKVKTLLRPQKDQVLIDLYSGYGLFSQYLADYYAEVFGMEADLEGVKAAKENVTHTNKKNVRFLAMRVTSTNIDKYIPKSFRYEEVFILDPPKIGTEDKVIQAIAARTPNKVLHIFCGTDNIPEELKKWEQFNYKPVVISPMDLFPGTANLEVLVLLMKRP